MKGRSLHLQGDGLEGKGILNIGSNFCDSMKHQAPVCWESKVLRLL